MKKCVKAYREKLEEGIKDFMAMKIGERSATAVNAMIEVWLNVKAMEDKLPSCKLSMHDIVEWNSKMKNSDGSIGGHWTVEQTLPFAEQLNVRDVDKYEWNVTMNMMYSDYGVTMSMNNITSPQVYAEMAKNFLHDIDAPSASEKLALYHDVIVAKQ